MENIKYSTSNEFKKENEAVTECLKILANSVKKQNSDCEKVAFLSCGNNTYLIPTKGHKPIKAIFENVENCWTLGVDKNNEIYAERKTTKEEHEQILEALERTGINSYIVLDCED